MAWYNLIDDNEPKSIREYNAQVKFERLHTQAVKGFSEIVDRTIEPNVQYRIITEMAFNAITVIDFLEKKYKFEEIHMAVFRMNERAVRLLMEFINRQNTSLDIVLSNLFLANKRYELWAHDLKRYCDERQNTHAIFLKSHAKVFAGKTICGQHFVFEGSGNYADNSRYEQYIFENNEEAFNFHKHWITQLTRNENRK